MTTFADLMSRDPLFAEYFETNVLIKQLICSLITNFFHLQSQGMQETMKLETFGLKLNGEMFQRSLDIFKDACRTQQLNPILLEQAQNIYLKLEPHINVPMSMKFTAEDLKTPVSNMSKNDNFGICTFHPSSGA